MTTPLDQAYARWLSAERDVHDAAASLLWAIGHAGLDSQVKQQNVVNILRAEASRLLRDYLALMAEVSSQLGAKQLH